MKQYSFTRDNGYRYCRCIQKLLRTEPEGSEHAQWKIEKTAQYWAAQEKEAAMNYHCVLELNNSVSNKRV